VTVVIPSMIMAPMVSKRGRLKTRFLLGSSKRFLEVVILIFLA
jgi:hypothetical protein